MLEYPLDIRGVLIQKTSACRDPNWIAPFIWEGKIETYLDKLRPPFREKYRLIIESDCNYDAKMNNSTSSKRTRCKAGDGFLGQIIH